jgi:hypothetical protein
MASENPFVNEKGQLLVQEITDRLDDIFADLGNVVSALTAHRTKLLTDAELEEDAKEFDLERSAGAVNLASGAEIQLRELKKIIVPFTKF